MRDSVAVGEGRGGVSLDEDAGGGGWGHLGCVGGAQKGQRDAPEGQRVRSMRLQFDRVMRWLIAGGSDRGGEADIDRTSAHTFATTSLALASGMGKGSKRTSARAIAAGVGSLISMTVTKGWPLKGGREV